MQQFHIVDPSEPLPEGLVLLSDEVANVDGLETLPQARDGDGYYARFVLDQSVERGSSPTEPICKRNELSANAEGVTYMEEGREYWVGVSYFLPSVAPPGAHDDPGSNGTIVTQFKFADNGTPPVLRVSDGGLAFHSWGVPEHELFLAELPYDRWVDLVMHVRWEGSEGVDGDASDDGDGLLEFWVDWGEGVHYVEHIGTNLGCAQGGELCHRTQAYLKVGLYDAHANDGFDGLELLYLDEYRVAEGPTARPLVEPLPLLGETTCGE